jgi:putative endonuclease
MYYLYILRCLDGTLYTGIALDVARRVAEHNSPNLGAKYTRSRRPVRLLYTQPFESRAKATSEEYRVKQLTRAQKLALVKKKKSDA